MTPVGKIEVFSKNELICFRVRIQPRAAKNEIVGAYERALKIRITSPPVGGRANRQLLDLLAELLDLRKEQISIVSGLSSRTKTIGIQRLSRSEVVDRIAQYLV